MIRRFLTAVAYTWAILWLVLTYFAYLDGQGYQMIVAPALIGLVPWAIVMFTVGER